MCKYQKNNYIESIANRILFFIDNCLAFRISFFVCLQPVKLTKFPTFLLVFKLNKKMVAL